MGAPSGFSSFNSGSPLTDSFHSPAAARAVVSSVVAFTRVVRKHFAHTELAESCAAGALRTVALLNAALWRGPSATRGWAAIASTVVGFPQTSQNQTRQEYLYITGCGADFTKFPILPLRLFAGKRVKTRVKICAVTKRAKLEET